VARLVVLLLAAALVPDDGPAGVDRGVEVEDVEAGADLDRPPVDHDVVQALAAVELPQCLVVLFDHRLVLHPREQIERDHRAAVEDLAVLEPLDRLLPVFRGELLQLVEEDRLEDAVPLLPAGGDPVESVLEPGIGEGPAAEALEELVAPAVLELALP